MPSWFDRVFGGQDKPWKPPERPRGTYVPSKHDSFYVEGRGSGSVYHIDWNEKEISVQYVEGEIITYKWCEVEDKYQHRYGGIWVPDY